MLRTHKCNEIRVQHVGSQVTLCGWVQSVRDHGSLIFILLRDRYGVVQFVSDSSWQDKELHKLLMQAQRESCVELRGEVIKRSEKDIKPEMETGQIEIKVTGYKILGPCDLLPFEIDELIPVNDETRLKYRYLDLRKERLKKNIILRHKLRDCVRNFYNKEGFLEVETPIFVRSTPEGARDYVVPCRTVPGTFYALPQSPQLYKQLLMISGFDRYYQFAPCFRDEDLRADRAPIHTQIDMEMSFVTQEDIFDIIERLFKDIFLAIKNHELKLPFQRMTYHEAMNNYGSDKPDLRFDLKLKDISEVAFKGEFEAFLRTKNEKGVVFSLVAPGCAARSRKELESWAEEVKKLRNLPLYWAKVENGTLQTGIAKFFNGDLQKELINYTGAKEGDLLFTVSGEWSKVVTTLGMLRKKLGTELKLIDEKLFKFLWVVDFPLFEYDEEEKKWLAMHHVFTKPQDQFLDNMEKDPGRVLGYLYDCVLNGTELLSGSIRINRPDVQKRILDIISMPEEEAEQKFGFFLRALKFGAPPHGGCAIGLDRLVAILCGETTIREVIAFPHNTNGQYLIDGSPSRIDKKQLEELHLKLVDNS